MNNEYSLDINTKWLDFVGEKTILAIQNAIS